ncbi:MAG TPA: type II toxin-antitoxin system death-on-curing family toxin [Candidatus Paceibacterota bacterium]
MKYLTGEEILVLHARVIDETGGLHGIRDIHLFLSIVEKPKANFGGRELYKNVFDKAAVYLETLAHFHVFIDGNKRTAFVSASRFLFLNKVELKVTNKEVENFVVQVAVQKLNIDLISAWLEKHSKKM